mmetsp:Transcript_29309/g.62102  ORF Transcript_29309/g.62102 Transcript_29309/m.62102 type:complete len:264 (-) Transcript_29309:14-805(-)
MPWESWYTFRKFRHSFEFGGDSRGRGGGASGEGEVPFSDDRGRGRDCAGVRAPPVLPGVLEARDVPAERPRRPPAAPGGVRHRRDPVPLDHHDDPDVRAGGSAEGLPARGRDRVEGRARSEEHHPPVVVLRAPRPFLVCRDLLARSRFSRRSGRRILQAGRVASRRGGLHRGPVGTSLHPQHVLARLQAAGDGGNAGEPCKVLHHAGAAPSLAPRSSSGGLRPGRPCLLRHPLRGLLGLLLPLQGGPLQEDGLLPALGAEEGG